MSPPRGCGSEMRRGSRGGEQRGGAGPEDGCEQSAWWGVQTFLRKKNREIWAESHLPTPPGLDRGVGSDAGVGEERGVTVLIMGREGGMADGEV